MDGMEWNPEESPSVEERARLSESLEERENVLGLETRELLWLGTRKYRAVGAEGGGGGDLIGRATTAATETKQATEWR